MRNKEEQMKKKKIWDERMSAFPWTEERVAARMRNNVGYLDYAVVCKEMDEIMKTVPDDEWKHPAGVSVFEYFYNGTRGATSRDYFMDLMERAENSTSGPRDERYALYVASESMWSFFYYKGRVYERNNVIYKAFHDRVKWILEHINDEGKVYCPIGYGLIFTKKLRVHLEQHWDEIECEQNHESTCCFQ